MSACHNDSMPPVDIDIMTSTLWNDASDDKILRADEISTPTSNEPFFFDAQANGTPSPVKTHRCQARRSRQPSWAIANQLAHGNVEPSDVPCSEEIPWGELVFWLGNENTGQVECPCPGCGYRRLSAKIPIVAIPRIEGVN